MQLSDPFAGGGKAIKSDIVPRVADFTRNFIEYLLEIGTEQFFFGTAYTLLQGSVVYTVPDNIIAYLLNLTHGSSSSIPAFHTTSVYFKEITLPISVHEHTGGYANTTTAFNPPMKLEPGHTIGIMKSIASVSVRVACTLRIIEVPKRIS